MARDVDVLVIGCGAAGASAAIAAHDAGARVRVLEKTAAGGGNARYSGGFLFDVDDTVALEHLEALCFGATDRDVLSAYAEGLHALPAWLEALGGHAPPVDPAAFGGLLPSWPHFPGAGHVVYRQFETGDGAAPGRGLWAMFEHALSARAIDVVPGRAATELTVEKGRVTGAIAGGEAIRARRGVILASGGFEYDRELREAYLPLHTVPVGHDGNTGDTLRLAQQAGAALWHMSAFFGWLAFAHPDFPAAFTLDVHAPSFIYVDGDGRRFADETGWEVHDKVRALTTYLPRRPNRPRMPGYLIFDEAARLAGPLHGVVGTPNDYTWSADNAAELERGWIQRGDTAAELAAATGLDRGNLETTLDAYAQATCDGRDDAFGRAPETLVALAPPLYAIEIRPGLATASGGPRRDARARVLAPGGAPIPGLYAAGGAGSIWGHLTEHGGGLTDAIVFGRIAGTEAAAR